MESNQTGSNRVLFTILGFLLGIVAVCCACFTLLFAMISSVGSIGAGGSLDNQSLISTSSSSNEIWVINIKGTILNEPDGGALGILGTAAGTYGYEVKEILQEAADNPNVKAIILEVSSPGGTVTGSNAISEGIEYFKEKTGKPVIGFGFGVVASGGYWAIAPADTIIVDAGSTIGSIGVISGQLTYYDGLIAEGEFLGGSYEAKNEIKKYYISAGEGKGLGYPFREPTKKELDNLQAQANSVYEDFVTHVNKHRPGLTKQEIKQEIGAYVYDTNNAVKNGLIDSKGNFDDALSAALEAAEIVGNDYSLVEQPQSEYDFFTSLLGNTPNSLLRSNAGLETDPECVLLQQSVIIYHGNIANLCR